MHLWCLCRSGGTDSACLSAPEAVAEQALTNSFRTSSAPGVANSVHLSTECTWMSSYVIICHHECTTRSFSFIPPSTSPTNQIGIRLDSDSYTVFGLLPVECKWLSWQDIALAWMICKFFQSWGEHSISAFAKTSPEMKSRTASGHSVLGILLAKSWLNVAFQHSCDLTRHGQASETDALSSCKPQWRDMPDCKSLTCKNAHIKHHQTNQILTSVWTPIILRNQIKAFLATQTVWGSGRSLPLSPKLVLLRAIQKSSSRIRIKKYKRVVECTFVMSCSTSRITRLLKYCRFHGSVLQCMCLSSGQQQKW
jgi:hypothetical protein